jgi:hypothetical protein
MLSRSNTLINGKLALALNGCGKMLTIGDILDLYKGFTAMCEEIPEIYFKGRHPYSTKLTGGTITVGQTRISQCSESELRVEMTALIKFAFAYNKMPLDEYVLDRFVKNQIPKVDYPPFIIHPGKYIITEIRQSGSRRYAHCETYKANLVQQIYFTCSDNGADGNERCYKIVGKDLACLNR